METLARKPCWGTATAYLFNFSRTGTRFALLLVLWVLALPPLLYGVWAGDSSFCSNVTEEANLSAFLCTLHHSEGRNSRDFFRVLAVLSALRGRASADCDCASFKFWVCILHCGWFWRCWLYHPKRLKKFFLSCW